MARRYRIAAVCVLVAAAVVALGLWGVYRAARQVRPFYQHALQLQPDVLERGRRELESQATALYSDSRNAGAWQTLFTEEQINGWLATQLVEGRAGTLPDGVREPRVAIGPDALTLGFTASRGGVETVVSVDAAVFLTAEGAVAIHLQDVRAGALPLPALQAADEIAAACQRLKLPVQWTQQDGQPIAIVDIGDASSSDKRRCYLDAIQLKPGELFVAGHTEVGLPMSGMARGKENATLEIAHRPDAEPPSASAPAER